MKNYVILLAGGVGKRMGTDIPKQFLEVDGKPIIVYSIENFQRNPQIEKIVVVCVKDWIDKTWELIRKYSLTKVEWIIEGGNTGHDSIRNGVFELEKHFEPTDLVLIHDAIRPMVSAEIISDNIRVAKQHGNAITVIPCAEAMMQTEDGLVSVGSYPRDRLKRTQTPQAFRIGDICDLHRRALEAGITNSVASCTLKIEMGEQVYFSAGSEKNIKLTTVEDIDIFKALLAAKRSDWLK